VKVVKNKVAPPFREAEFDIIYGEGVSMLSELIDLALEHDIVQKSGSWYSYGDEKVGQGRDAAKQWLKEHGDARAEVTAKVKEALGMGGAAGHGAASDADEEEPAEASNGRASFADF
jgi:recombination protein RecA